MIINIGIFTFIAMLVLLICAYRIEDTDDDAFFGCWLGIVPLFAVSLICFCNPESCNVDFNEIVQIKCSSSQTDKKVAELEQKYNNLLKMKFNEAK